MEQTSFFWVERDNIKLAFVATTLTFTDMNIAPDKIAIEFIPLGNELF